MKTKTYYDVLKVSKDADINTIKKSWKQLMLQWHPDKNPNSKEAEEMSKAINAAYEVLSDDTKRKAYDAKILRDEKIKEQAKRPKQQTQYTVNKQASTTTGNWGVFFLLLIIGAIFIGIANSGNKRIED